MKTAVIWKFWNTVLLAELARQGYGDVRETCMFCEGWCARVVSWNGGKDTPGDGQELGNACP